MVAAGLGGAAILTAIGAWALISQEPLTERQKAEQSFQALQIKDEQIMRERCKEPFGPNLTEREERNRKWCIANGLLD
jgi:hypothetical protein